MTGKLLFKFQCHIFTYFITVLADRWAYRTPYILRYCSICFCHCFQRGSSHSVNRAPPAGMAQSDCPMLCIHKVKRHTVCIKGCKHQPRHIGNQSIHIMIRPFLCQSASCILCCYFSYIGGMGLVRADMGSHGKLV